MLLVCTRDYHRVHGRAPSGNAEWMFDIRATENQPAERERFYYRGPIQQAIDAARWHAFSILRLRAAFIKVMP